MQPRYTLWVNFLPSFLKIYSCTTEVGARMMLVRERGGGVGTGNAAMRYPKRALSEESGLDVSLYVCVCVRVLF